MNYIVFDLEFNQDFSSLQQFPFKTNHYPFEIIQIGAIQLDASFHQLGTFNRYVKPYFYGQVCPFITQLTGITTPRLTSEALFPEVYRCFLEFVGDEETIFCIWGMSDIKELFKNAFYHQLPTKQLPHHFINIQPLVSSHLGLPTKKLLRLEHAVSALHIAADHTFHDALSDAHYTAEIWKKIYHPSIHPTVYDPTYTPRPTSEPKKQIDTQALFAQFAKMYSRELTSEEEKMILLAYKMGKTQQFLK